jgi:hypothetical protein
MWHELGKTEMHIGFWWVKIKERDHVEDLGIDRILLKTGFKEPVSKTWTGLIRLRVGRSGGLF